jgi:hypothetical protein
MNLTLYPRNVADWLRKNMPRRAVAHLSADAPASGPSPFDGHNRIIEANAKENVSRLIDQLTAAGTIPLNPETGKSYSMDDLARYPANVLDYLVRNMPPQICVPEGIGTAQLSADRAAGERTGLTGIERTEAAFARQCESAGYTRRGKIHIGR